VPTGRDETINKGDGEGIWILIIGKKSVTYSIGRRTGWAYSVGIHQCKKVPDFLSLYLIWNFYSPVGEYVTFGKPGAQN